MSAAGEIQPGARRKNGTIPSCENCRIAKARCDHQQPCARCSRQGKTCYFHPAPMSQRSRPDSAHPAPAKKRKVTSLNEPLKSAPPRKASAPTPNPLVLQSGAPFGYSRLPAKMSVNYMGSTGFGAILEENQQVGLWENLDERPLDTAEQLGRDDHGPWRKFGASILAWVPSAAIFQSVIEFYLTEGFCSPVDPYSQSVFARRLWSTYGSLLSPSNGNDRLGQLSDILTANTRNPLPLPSSNQEWLDSFTGTNSRWETLGLMIVATGSAAFAVPKNDPLLANLLPKDMSRKSFACSLLEAADAALMISEEVSTSRSILQALLLGGCTQLQSMVAGDTSHELWMRLGSMAAAITGLGLHLRASEAETRSALYYQTRLHCFAVAFNMDKCICTFTGRPPLFSRRFVSVDLPLDVSYAAVFNESSIAELQKSLSVTGWDLEGRLHEATEQRAGHLINMLRDEILELALTTAPVSSLTDKINYLRSRIDETWNGLPSLFRVRIDKKAVQEMGRVELCRIINTQLAHLHNIFLVERIEHSGKDEQRLLEAARDILSTVVLFWGERDRYPSFRDLIHWLLCCYGISAGSALAIDLYKQTVFPSVNPPSPQRASTIQNLSIFVACLEWVGPDDGNYVLCGRVSKVIQNILERALAPNSEAVDTPLSGYDMAEINLADMPAFGQDLDSWFDTNGWATTMQY